MLTLLRTQSKQPLRSKAWIGQADQSRGIPGRTRSAPSHISLYRLAGRSRVVWGAPGSTYGSSDSDGGRGYKCGRLSDRGSGVNGDSDSDRDHARKCVHGNASGDDIDSCSRSPSVSPFNRDSFSSYG